MKVTIIPNSGEPYTVTINVPKGTDDIDKFLSDWMDANLKNVSGYRRR